MKQGETDMIMVVGGAHQGKRRFAKQLYPDIPWINGETCGEEEIFLCRGIYHFHEYIAERMREGADLSGFSERLYAKNQMHEKSPYTPKALLQSASHSLSPLF